MRRVRPGQTFPPRLLSESAVFPMWIYTSPVAGGFQGGHGKANLLLPVCACCAETPAVAPVTPPPSSRMLALSLYMQYTGP